MSKLTVLPTWLAAFVLTQDLNGQCDAYSVEFFRSPFCGIFGFTGVSPTAINEQGTIVGYHENCSLDLRGFIWTGGPTLTPLPEASGMSEARAYDVNAQQHIVGRRDMNGAAIGDRGFVFADGTYTDLGDLLNSNHVDPSGVNDFDQVCGYTNNTGSGPLRAFLWENGTMSALQLPVGVNSIARDINNVGQVVGWMGQQFGTVFPAEAFLWQNGIGISLGIPKGGHNSEAAAISDNGEIAGHYFVEVSPGENRRRGFHWKDGTFNDLGLMPGTEVVSVLDINNRGEIIGSCALANGQNRIPFLWRDGVMTDLRTLVTLPANFTLNEVWAINNQGQIAAGGRDYNTTPISAPGFRLTPVSKIPGDYDCNHLVDIDDLLGVIGHWGSTPGGGNAPADFNHDGAVNVADLLTVILHWTP